MSSLFSSMTRLLTLTLSLLLGYVCAHIRSDDDEDIPGGDGNGIPAGFRAVPGGRTRIYSCNHCNQFTSPRIYNARRHVWYVLRGSLHAERTHARTGTHRQTRRHADAQTRRRAGADTHTLMGGQRLTHMYACMSCGHCAKVQWSPLS